MPLRVSLEGSDRKWSDSSSYDVVVATAIALVVIVASVATLSVLDPPHAWYGRQILLPGLVPGLLAGLFAFSVLRHARQMRFLAERHLKVIADMNHHIRNALEVIRLSAFQTKDHEHIAQVNEATARVEWALREILGKEIQNENAVKR